MCRGKAFLPRANILIVSARVVLSVSRTLCSNLGGGPLSAWHFAFGAVLKDDLTEGVNGVRFTLCWFVDHRASY